jgi:hypothetical protein
VQRTATHSVGERLSIFGLAFGVLAGALGVAFAAGWFVGRLWL